LAKLRCASFGRWLRGWTACERCGEKLEFEVDGAALARNEEPESQSTRSIIEVDGQAFRLPTTRHLAAIASEADASKATTRLLEVCLVEEEQEVARKGSDSSPHWGEEQIEAIGASMALADPMAEILLHFDCPQCSHGFDTALDPAAFLWTEVEGRAKRLLLDVHLLASAYGWGEAEILSMNPMRRSFYLEMVRG
jgi:hypothetical protein